MLCDKVIVGCSPFLELAAQDWLDACPGIRLELRTVELDRSYCFSDELLSAVEPTKVTAFVAWGSDFLNFQRWELFGALKTLGYKLPGLAHPTSILPNDFKLNEGVWIRPYALIGQGAEVGVNSVIGPRAQVGTHCCIGRSVSLGANASLGGYVQVGANTILGDGVTIFDRKSIGRNSFMEPSKLIFTDVSEGSFSIRASGISGRVFNLVRSHNNTVD